MENLTNWHVLVVEDEHDAQNVLSALLQTKGIRVSVVPTAEQALEHLNADLPNAVIVDLSLPQMNGWELLRTMREHPGAAAIPAVAITAYHSANVAEDAINAGFAAYFSKPVQGATFVEDLVSAIS